MEKQIKWRYVWLLVILSVFSSPAVAQYKFATAQLQKLSEQIAMPATMKEGVNYGVTRYNGHPITIVMTNKKVTHIGYSLFSPSQRIRETEPHCAFLERLLLSADIKDFYGTSIENYLKEEKIVFNKGSLQDLKALVGDTNFNYQVNQIEGKKHAMSLYVNNSRRITIIYPINLQLVRGATMQEIEGDISADLRRTRIEETMPFSPVESMLQRVGNSPIYLLPGDIYMLPQLTSNRFYVRHDDGSFHTLFSADFPMESMANLCTGIDIPTEIELAITLIRYGHVKEDLRVPLRQWVAYCLQQGCTPYFGVIDHDDNETICEVVMHHEDFNYNHVMKFSFDPTVLKDGKGIVRGRWNSYVQMSNVKSLFNEK